jgi:orotate phosphoribosyltransferase
VTATTEIFAVGREELRQELAADLSRGGYVYRGDGGTEEEARYFDKHLVLTHPGLLTRSARLMSDLIPAECEGLAVTSIASTTLGTALSQETGVPLLLGSEGADEQIRFGGEIYSKLAVVLLEDVVFTGRRALAGTSALERINTEILAVICLLDREAGGAQRLAEAGYRMRPLFTESELLAGAHGS